jgi:hypothetical protein
LRYAVCWFGGWRVGVSSCVLNDAKGMSHVQCIHYLALHMTQSTQLSPSQAAPQ